MKLPVIPHSEEGWAESAQRGVPGGAAKRRESTEIIVFEVLLEQSLDFVILFAL